MNAASHRFRELSNELRPGVQNDPPDLAKIDADAAGAYYRHKLGFT
jgi:hypothetical protein